ncbi:MAG: hypothetical protein U9R68_08535, partial [Planctomycetota bacterium]|nr:hypothetical protein [Planctomycetota bacterium]
MERLCVIVLAGLVGLALATGIRAEISVQFDYTYDDGFFTNHPERRAALEFAAACLTRFTDDLDPIIPSGGSTWEAQVRRPDTGDEIWVENLVVPADALIVYAGGRNLGGGGGCGGPGGWSASGFQPWFDAIRARGESGALDSPATDFGPWGGDVAFNTAPAVDWYFGLDPAGLGAGQADFLSVALHELGHVLGIGTADSWDTCLSGGVFTGPAAVDAYGGNVPVDAIASHWASGTMSEVDGAAQEAAMDPELTQGTRKLFTDLDFAGLDDVGWEVMAGNAWSGAGGTAWADGGNWSEGSPPDANSAAVFKGSASNQPLLGQDAGVWRVEFHSTAWTVSSTGHTLTVGDGGIDSAGSGTNTVEPNVALGSDSAWSVGAGNTLVLSGALSGGGNTLAKDGDGTLVLGGGQDHATGLAMTISGGTVRLGDAQTLVLDALAIDLGPALDLTSGNLIVDYDGPGPNDTLYDAIEGWVTTGYNGGAWNGEGINSSLGDPALYALGVLDNGAPPAGITQLTAVDGVDLAALFGDVDCIVVKYTYYGDADMDGTVDFDDVQRLILSYN